MAVPFQVIFAKVATFPFHPNQCCIWSNISAQHYGGGGREGNIGDKEINAKSIQLFLLEVVFYEKLLGRAFAAGRSSFDP